MTNMYYMSNKGLQNFTNVLNYAQGGSQFSMDVKPYKYDYSLDVWNIAGKYSNMYIFSAEPMEYSSSLLDMKEVVIELYLSEVQSNVQASPKNVLNGASEIGGFVSIVTCLDIVFKFLHYYMYEAHLRDRYRADKFKKKSGFFWCCRLLCPFGAEREAKLELQKLISIENFYKIASSYDQLLQDVERLKAELKIKNTYEHKKTDGIATGGIYTPINSNLKVDEEAGIIEEEQKPVGKEGPSYY